jgi:hypothetical protein
MCRSAWALAVFAAALAVCGCNENAPAASAPPPPQAAPADFSALPPNAPCTAKINNYQAVLVADHRTGNVEDPVFNQIEHELSDAAAACSAGHDAQSLAMIHASQDKHGYHT